MFISIFFLLPLLRYTIKQITGFTTKKKKIVERPLRHALHMLVKPFFSLADFLHGFTSRLVDTPP